MRLSLHAGFQDVMASPQEIIALARAGQMFILVDDEDRENEGDLVIPADCADARAITFMARQGCGLVCLALAPEIADKLELAPMTAVNGCVNATAFTVSIEARSGISTGISATDRARTIAVAIDPASGAADLTSPGHMFPLRAKAGGVLERAGHTEAAVDIARLAGRPAAGVICEIMNEDGSMARMEDLRLFARRHDLRIGRICDLIAYRSRL